MKKVYDLSRKVAENYTGDHVFFFHLKEDNSECPHKVTEIFTAIFNHKIFLLYFLLKKTVMIIHIRLQKTVQVMMHCCFLF